MYVAWEALPVHIDVIYKGVAEEHLFLSRPCGQPYALKVNPAIYCLFCSYRYNKNKQKEKIKRKFFISKPHQLLALLCTKLMLTQCETLLNNEIVQK